MLADDIHLALQARHHQRAHHRRSDGDDDDLAVTPRHVGVGARAHAAVHVAAALDGDRREDAGHRAGGGHRQPQRRGGVLVPQQEFAGDSVDGGAGVFLGPGMLQLGQGAEAGDEHRFARRLGAQGEGSQLDHQLDRHRLADRPAGHDGHQRRQIRRGPARGGLGLLRRGGGRELGVQQGIRLAAERQLRPDHRAGGCAEDEVGVVEGDARLRQAGDQPGLPGDPHRTPAAQNQRLAHVSSPDFSAA